MEPHVVGPASGARLVAVQLPPGPRFSAALDQIWAEGDACLPLDPRMSTEALHLLLLAMRPHLLIDAGGHNSIASPVEVEAGTALVVMTSGTTGDPKGVRLTHEALTASARATTERLQLDGTERWLCCLPLHHIAGLQVLYRARLAGIPPVVHDGFEVEAVAEAEADLVSLVPTMLHRLLDAGADMSRFKAVLVGGMACPSGLLRRARAAGANVVRTYGMTETGGGCVYDGRPLPGVEVRTSGSVVELRGPMMMSGYRVRPDLTEAALSQDGWFSTNDLGEWDGTTLKVRGRADRVIVTGGEKVSPEKVEAALLELEVVAEARVVGEPDEAWGERVVALVVPVPGADPDPAHLRESLRSELARHELPSVIRSVRSLPATALGKPRRTGA